MVARPAPDLRHTPEFDVERRLADAVSELFAERDEDAVVARLAAGLDALVVHDALTVYALDGKGELLLPTFASGVAGEEPRAPLPVGEGVPGRAARRRAPVVWAAKPERRIRLVSAGESAPTARLAVPLLARGELKGVVALERHDDACSFDVDEVELVRRLCDSAALALANAEERALLEHQARTDSLTGLLNHRSFHERLREALADARAVRREVAVLMLDVDDFKWINDVHGHDAGDELLQLLGQALRACVRPDDAVCRLGGEEFAVVMGGLDGGDALGVAERVLERIATLDLPSVGAATVSIGVACGPRDGADARGLAACAEAAMMTAKAHGKNRVVVYDERSMQRPDGVRGPRSPRELARLETLAATVVGLDRLCRLPEVGERIIAAAGSLAPHVECRVLVVDEGRLALLAGADLDDETELLARRGVVRREVVIERIGDRVEAALPLRRDGEPVGALLVRSPAEHPLDRRELHLLELLAVDAAVAVENALRYEEALRDSEHANVRLEETFASSIESLANALEVSDGDTLEHARWISELAVWVGAELRLDPQALERLELGALLHDIGKIGIGSSLLSKPGRLTAAERSVIERHPALGEWIIAPIDRLQDVRRIVRHCHERWDGRGYPDGLAGEEIPLESRIVFVCDAFHAMTSDRPYRRALRRGEAVRRLRAGAGTQFDPAVVDAALRVLERIA